jgi:hypothetical protein
MSLKQYKYLASLILAAVVSGCNSGSGDNSSSSTTNQTTASTSTWKTIQTEILDKNCTSCHKKTNAEGGLDLSNWLEVKPKVFGFPHVDKNTRQQVEPRVTFERIIERLSSSDVKRRMPLGKFMRDVDRDALYIWAQKR